jgi:nitrogen fixation NifU-like protein
VAHLSEGRELKAAWEIIPEDVIDFLETLPPGNTHCAELAVGTFYLALSNYWDLKQNPWKKAYQKK